MSLEMNEMLTRHLLLHLLGGDICLVQGESEASGGTSQCFVVHEERAGLPLTNSQPQAKMKKSFGR